MFFTATFSTLTNAGIKIHAASCSKAVAKPGRTAQRIEGVDNVRDAFEAMHVEADLLGIAVTVCPCAKREGR